jgi:tetratricopeptide (TPR) repeat protein
MFRVLFIACFAALTLISVPASAQSNSEIKKATYRAYTIAKISLWDDAISLAEECYSQSGALTDLHDLIIAQYGYIAFCIGERLNDKGKLMLKSAYLNLDKLGVICEDQAEILALKASLIAYEMNFYPLKMMKLGARAIDFTNRAYESDPENLMALSCKANQLNFTPKLFGGSPKDAIPIYKKIIKLYETHSGDTEENWRYISTQVTLAATYEDMKMYNEACELYEQIISFDSNINWINNSLYPACREKLKAQESGNSGKSPIVLK